MIYFFYSQNLMFCEVGDSGPEHFKLIGKVRLKDYKLTFRFFANVEPSIGDYVDGCLFYVNPTHKKIIEESEMCPELYTKRDRLLQSGPGIEGIHGQVFMQKFTKQLPLQQPHPNYLANLYKLYMENDLPLDQINNAMSEFETYG